MGSTVAAEGEAVGWVAVGGEEGEKIYVAGSTTKPWCYIKEVSINTNYTVIFKLAD